MARQSKKVNSKGAENFPEVEMTSRKIESDKQFAGRVMYGSQLMDMMALADVSISELEETIPYIHAVLTNNRFPSIDHEFYLMEKLGYIPLYSFVDSEFDGMSEVWYDTQQAVLQAGMLQRGFTLNQLTSYLKASGFSNYSVPGNVLKGNNCAYASMKDIMENMAYRFDVALLKVDGAGMERYVNTLEVVHRDNRVFDKKVKELREAAEKGFYKYSKGIIKPTVKPKKEETLEDKLKKIERVVFVDNFKTMTRVEPEAVLSGYHSKVRDKFMRFDLTSMEIAKQMVGKTLKIRIEVSDIDKKASKAKRGAVARNCNSIKEAIEFVYTVYYGSLQDSNKSAAMAKVYNGSSALNIKTFNSFLKAHNAVAYIAI